MSMEDIAAEIREKLSDGWTVVVSESGILTIQGPREMTPEQVQSVTEKWYEVTAAMPRPWRSTYHVTLDDESLFEQASLSAKKHGLKLVPTDEELVYQVVIDEAGH